MKRLLLLISSLISLSTIAAESCPPEIQFRASWTGGTSVTAKTKDLVCAKVTQWGVTWVANPSEDSCVYTESGGSKYYVSLARVSTCPYGTNPDGTCKCPDPCQSKAGMWDNGGDPQSVNLPGPLPFYSGETGGKIGMPDTICLNGCVADTTQDRGDGMSTSSWWGYNMNPKYNGQSCSSGTPKPGSSKPKDSDEKKCVDKGMGFGYFNEKVVCVKPDTSSGSAKKSTETKNPDGTTTKVDTTTNISCNAEGACSTTTTTTTTVINADGSTASTKTETKKEDSQGNAGTGTGDGTGFCKENPTSPMCKSGSFNGNCSQAPACEGDPVQCATAKAVFEANCKALKPGDPPTTSEPVGEKKHQISFTPSELGGGGNCPANRSVTVMGKVINFDFSIMCQFALTIRPVVIAIGWLLAGYIVFGYRGKGS